MTKINKNIIDLSNVSILTDEDKTNYVKALKTYVDFKQKESELKILKDQAEEAKTLIRYFSERMLNKEPNSAFNILVLGARDEDLKDLNFDVSCSISKESYDTIESITASINKLKQTLETLRALEEAQQEAKIVARKAAVTLQVGVITN